MAAATINKINDAVKGYGVEVVNGYGYFYFADLPGVSTYNAEKIESVFSPHLRCMSLEDWVEHVEDCLA